MSSLFSNPSVKPKSLFNNQSAINMNVAENIGSEIHVNKSGTNINVVQIIFSAGLFLLPFFFLPFTTDVLNLNKTYLVLYLSLASLLAYIVDGYLKKSLVVRDFGAYLPALILLAGGLLSVFFSQNQVASIYGQSGTYSSSFLTLVALVIVSFVSANVELRVGKLLVALIAGTTLSTLVSWMAMYGVTLPYLGALFSGFTLADSFGGLLGLQVISSLGALYLMLRSRPSYVYALLGIAFVLNASFGLVTLNVYFITVLICGLFYLAATSDIALKSQKTIVISILTAVLVIAFVHLLPGLTDKVGFNRNIQFPRLDIASSWHVTGSSLIYNPLFGTGLGTYLNDFTKYRPAALNTSVYWESTFQYPFNDLFLWLSTAGLVGAVAYLVFVLLLGKKALKVKGEKGMYLVSFVVLFSLVTMMLLGGSLALSVFVFILAGVLYQNKFGSALNIKSQGTILFFAIVVLGLAGLLSFRTFKVYAAQIAFRKSLTQESLLDRYQLQRQAITADPYESFYYREVILTNLATASRLSQAENLTDKQKEDIQNLLVQAVNDSRLITEMLDPKNSANWEVRGALYRSMIGLDKEKNQFTPLAQQAYMNAINVNPTNPRLYVDLGGIFYTNKDYQNAVNYFARAVQLKPDYANAYYNLAFALKDGGAYADAVTQLEVVQRLAVADSEDAKKVAKDLVEFKKLADDAAKKAAAEKAMVDVPAVGEPADGAKTGEGEPITNASDTQPKIDPNADVDVKKIEDASKPQSGVSPTPSKTASPTQAPADGSSVDKKAGETDAPIANPQN